MSFKKAPKHTLIPKSIAIIMDGNGRWAEKRGLDRNAGHYQGSKVAEEIIRYAGELGVQFITLYAFSTENWQRPATEVEAIMHILENYLKNNTDDLVKNGIRICAVGDLNRLPSYLKKSLDEVIIATKKGTKLVITLALSYGSWAEVAHACQEIAKKVVSKEVAPHEIDEQMIGKYLYTNDIPHPDLLIRTSGEMRLSNFLLLQLSYAELYFTKTLWPDFQRSDLDLAIKDFASRQRRFGTTSNH